MAANSWFEEHRRWRVEHGKPRLAIEVRGPRRDYDFSLFCCDHNNEAEECAAEWTAALIDDLDAGESADFKITVRAWEEGTDECCECEAMDTTDG